MDRTALIRPLSFNEINMTIFGRMAAAILAAGSTAPKNDFNLERLYPYLVPAGYPTAATDRELGNGLRVALVVENSPLTIRNVTDAELKKAGLSPAQAGERALTNLEVLMKSGAIQMQVFPSGSPGRSFILAGGHWAAATAMLLPGLRRLAAQTLHAEELCASVPHREALLIFEKGDPAFRKEMRALVRKNESDGAKPLTFDLFQLTERGPAPLVE